MKIKLLFLIIISTLFFSCKKKQEIKENNEPKNTEKVLLRLNLKNGSEHFIAYEMQTNGDNVSVSEKVGLSIHVIDTINNNYVFRGTVAYMKIDSNVLGQKDFYDSSKKTEKMSYEELQFHNEFKNAIGQPITFTFSNKGKIVKPFEYEGDLKLEQAIELNNYQIVFPEKEVGIGDTWESEYAIKLTGKIAKKKYTIVSVMPDEVIVKVEMQIPGIKDLIKETKYTGEYTLDRKTGRLIEGKMEGELNQMNAKATYVFTGSEMYN